MTDPRLVALAPLLTRVRTDVTAVKKADGTTAWTREPLTKAAVLAHFRGAPARGCAPMGPGTTTRVALLDFDSHKGATPWAEMVACAQRVRATADVFGLPSTAFRSSGGRGVHLVFLWREPQDAAGVRAALVAVLGACGLTNGAAGVARGAVEVFPKQDSVDVDGLGNMFILPFSGQSVPLMGDEMALGAVADFTASMWAFAEPVPAVEREVVVAQAPGGDTPIALVRAALFAIPNTGDAAPDYDGWRDLVFAAHSATGGSPEGLDLVEEWSAQNERHNPKFLAERVWPYVRQREGGKTFATLAWRAREHGWDEAAHAALVFEDLDDSPKNVAEIGHPAVGVGAEQAEAGRSRVAGAVPVALRKLPAFERDKHGAVPAKIENVALAVERADVCGMRVRYDRFRDELMWAPEYVEAWRAFKDADYVALRRWLERVQGFAPIGRELIRDVVDAVAQSNAFDSAQAWLDGLMWDGVKRVDAFLPTYWGTEDSEYTRAVGAYLWTALAGRVLEPGVKADMVPIAIGAQGAGKSTGIAALAPAPEFFTEIAFGERDADLARKMRGKVVAEIAELRGLHTREREAILAFITRTHEEWVPKFREFTTLFPRRLVFFGSTNHTEFLADETGYRRWLPFHAGRVDAAGITAARDQLWAEAALRFTLGGVAWAEAERLARREHAQHEIGDTWEATIGEWFDRASADGESAPRGRKFITVRDVLCEALGYEVRQIKRGDEMRAASALKRMGFVCGARQRVGSGQRIYPYTLSQPSQPVPTSEK